MRKLLDHFSVAIVHDDESLCRLLRAEGIRTRWHIHPAEAFLGADDNFPANEYLRIENGEPVLKRLQRKPGPEGLSRLEQQLVKRMTHVDIVDALSDTEHWLNWSRFFGPISGHDAKLENPRERYLITTFCYGCNLGPTQTARSIKGLDRRQVSFVNQRHVTEENLN